MVNTLKPKSDRVQVGSKFLGRLINVFKILAKLLFYANFYTFSNTVYHLFTRKLPYYSSGCDWAFFNISHSLLHHLLPQWKPCRLYLRKHNNKRKDNFPRPWLKPGTGDYHWSEGKPGNHYTTRVGRLELEILNYKSESAWRDLVTNAKGCKQ